LPYILDAALAALAEVDVLILVGAQAPVAFFAYPNRPSPLTREDCEIQTLARPGRTWSQP
jgi:acetolactate synthase-1/2/3 large subunit